MAEKKTDAPPSQPEKEPEQGDAPETLTLTQEELDAKIADAVKAAVKADRKAKAKKKPEPEEDADDDEDEEDAAEIITKAESRAARAEQERDQAKKEALLAKVENKLNAHLALTAREFLGNAPDIMLHIAAALTADAKDGEIARLIDSHTKAFIDRSKAARKPASGAPAGGIRGRLAGLVGGTSDHEPDRTAARAAAGANAPARKPWASLHFNQ